jgi:transposase InsO family protein
MPFKERSVMDEKHSFIMEWLADGVSVTELCKAFSISRTTGYYYIGRYLKYGLKGLEPLSRAPHTVTNKTADCVEQLILSIRNARPRWGGKTIYLCLRKAVDWSAIPSIPTINLILNRHGLVKKRRRVHRIHEQHPIFIADRPNQIWSADFKGQFRTGDMRYCYPLTVMDTHSRFVFAIVGMYKPSFEATKALFEALFDKYGLPYQIHTDNGEPFASATSLSRLTRLSVWFMDLGITPVYSDPAHPEQNGEHERMHKDLKAEATRPAAWNLRKQQKKFDEFIREHNEIRPHQALDGRRPQELYYCSSRVYDGTIQLYTYPPWFDIRYVCLNGAIRWGANKWIFATTALAGKYVGLEPIAKGIWRVYFRNYLIGYLHEKEMRILDDLGRYRRVQKV